MRKVYVAGRTNMLAEVRTVQAHFIARNYKITHDWTRTVEAVGGAARDDVVSATDQRLYAERDLGGVFWADLVAVVCGPALCGTLVELGAALAWKKPIILIGKPERHSVFFHMPGVYKAEAVSGLDHILAKLFPTANV